MNWSEYGLDIRVHYMFITKISNRNFSLTESWSVIKWDNQKWGNTQWEMNQGSCDESDLHIVGWLRILGNGVLLFDAGCDVIYSPGKWSLCFLNEAGSDMTDLDIRGTKSYRRQKLISFKMHKRFVYSNFLFIVKLSYWFGLIIESCCCITKGF